MQFDNAAMIHGTHKHSDLTPRYRLILPLDREATPEDVAVSRKIAGDLGIELFDNTTFETNRLMFWPSSLRRDYYFEQQAGPWLSVDEIPRLTLIGKTHLWPTTDKKIRELGEAGNRTAGQN
jgi:hypothetical protein